MSHDRSWTPTLEGDSHRAALAAIDGIVEGIMTEIRTGSSPEPPTHDPFLSLLLADVGLYRKDERLMNAARRVFETAVRRIGDVATRPALYGGFVGVAWLGSRMARIELDQESVERAFEDVDQALILHLRSAPPERYDLISGLVGIGVYAIERLPSIRGRSILEAVLARLSLGATKTPEGFCWLTPYAELPDHQRVDAPNGYFNLGMAHGLPGVIALLAHSYNAGVKREVVEPLLRGAVRWLGNQQTAAGDGSRFPSWVVPGSTARSAPAARLAWCYGGLGIAAALLQAARSLRDPTIEAMAIEVCLSEAARPAHRSGVADASLCHGAAGNAHIFARFYTATGDARFLTAARRWFSVTLSLRGSSGVGGFLFWRGPRPGAADDTAGFVADGTFLSGAAGVGLALLSAISHQEPNWDALLLTNPVQ